MVRDGWPRTLPAVAIFGQEFPDKSGLHVEDGTCLNAACGKSPQNFGAHGGIGEINLYLNS
jgi:hypothetical protein